MTTEVYTKINDVEKLQEIVLSLANKEQNYKSEIKILNEQIKSLRDKLFGRKTEKYTGMKVSFPFLISLNPNAPY